jgi:hypothetical protein
VVGFVGDADEDEISFLSIGFGSGNNIDASDESVL